MTKYYFQFATKGFSLFLAVLLSYTSQSQNVTLDQLISLRTKNLAAVEENLTAKNWEMTEASEPGDGTMGWATFAYGKNYYDDKATSFITYYYSGVYSTKRINIQINKATSYNAYISRLKALGYKLNTSKVEGDDIVKVYKGKSLTIQVSVKTQQDDEATKTTYHFFICSSLDYTLEFE